MKRLLRVALAAAVMAGAAASAQPTAGRAEPEPATLRREEVRRRLEELLVRRMQEVLELNDAQVAALRPRLSEIEKARRDFGRQRREQLRVLLERARDARATDAELEEGLAQLRAQEKAFHAAQETREQEALALLTPRQRVLYLPLRERLAGEVRRKIRELRDRAGAARPERPARRRRGGAAGGDGGRERSRPPSPEPAENQR